MPARPTRRRALFVGLGIGVSAVAALFYFSQPSPPTERDFALALAEQGPADEAVAALKRCLEHDPNDPTVLRALVRVLPLNGATLPDVEPYTRQWCQAAPDDPEAFRTRMKLLQQLKRRGEAIEPAERLLALTPNDHSTRVELTMLYLAVGRHEDAARECRRLLESSPLPRVDLLALLGRVEASRGNSAEAARVLDEALAVSPDHPHALLQRGIVFQQAGDDVQTIAVLRRVRTQSPDEKIIVLHHLGLSLARTGQADEARQTFDEQIRLQDAIHSRDDADEHPNDLPVQLRAGRSLLAAGMPKEAAQQLEAACARLGSTREMLNLLADCYDRLGSSKLAKTTRDQASRLPP